MNRAGGRWAALTALLLVAGMAPGLPGRLRAQPVTFVPYGGAILPQGKVYQQSGASIRHRAAVTFGGRLYAWVSGPVGVEVAVNYAPSPYRVDTAATSFDTTGGVLAASARVLFRFARTGPLSWHLIAGAGVVRHTGLYVANATDKTSLAGVLGLAGRFPLSSRIAALLAAEDYIYSAALGGFTGSLASTRQLNHDVVLSLGLELPLGARGDDN